MSVLRGRAPGAVVFRADVKEVNSVGDDQDHALRQPVRVAAQNSARLFEHSEPSYETGHKSELITVSIRVACKH